MNCNCSTSEGQRSKLQGHVSYQQTKTLLLSRTSPFSQCADNVRVGACGIVSKSVGQTNRQIRVGDSKNVTVFEPLSTGHVIRRMRNSRVRILKGKERETL